MKFSALIAALPLAVSAMSDLALLESTAVTSEMLEERQHSTRACPKRGVHIVAGPGAGGTGPEAYGYLSTTVKAIQHAIPGSNNYCLLPYKGSNGLYQTENAEHQVRKHIQKFHAKCPKTPIIMLGYSAGAIGGMDALCGASPAPPWKKTTAMNKPKNNIISLITYGDETFKAGMPYNRGSCTQNAPKYPRTTTKGCKGFFRHMRVYCDAADGDCCTGGVSGGPAHFAYPSKYDGAVAAFAKSQFRKWKKGHGKKHHRRHGSVAGLIPSV